MLGGQARPVRQEGLGDPVVVKGLLEFLAYGMHQASIGGMSEIKCPTCPVCGSAPLPLSIELGQAFCSSDDCNVLAWDPYDTKEANLFNSAYAEIDGEVPPKRG